MITFTSLGLDHKINMLPMGLVPFGCPARNARIALNDENIEKQLEALMLGMAEQAAREEAGRPLIVYIEKDGSAFGLLYDKGKSVKNNGMWTKYTAECTLESRPTTIKELIHVTRADRVAIFVEESNDFRGENGETLIRVLYTTDDELTYWYVKELKKRS